MNIEVMERKLYDACLKGDVEKLEALMREDELILARVSISSCFNQTPLHIASMLGHFEFAKSVLSYKPDFACRLDSQGRSPLHLASANGYPNIVELLLQYGLRMCRVSDEDGRTPLHLAVMNGQHESVSELIKVKSESRDQELGEALHLCVTYNRFNVLILILESTGQDFSNIKDEFGNTVLHHSTALRRVQIVKYLVMSRSDQVDVNLLDGNGLTAMDIIKKMPKDVKTMEIKELLISAGSLRAKEINEAATANEINEEQTSKSLLSPGSGGRAFSREPWGSTDSKSKLGKMWNKVKKFTIFQEKEEKRDETLLIAATVIAAMAYQAAISPPGNVAGIDAFEYSANSPRDKTYDLKPGQSLIAYFHPEISVLFWTYNTISFIAALSVVFLFVSGAALKRRLYVWLVRAGMWITLSSMTFAYVAAVKATIPKYEIYAVLIGLYIWIVMVFLSVLVVVYRFFSYCVRKLIKKMATRKNTSEDLATSRTQNTNAV